jgi:hypothetical protein
MRRRWLAAAMFWGGGSFSPTLVAFIWDDFSCNPFDCGWENYGAVGSSQSTSDWGDYLNSRPDSPFSNTWVATGFSYDGTKVTPQCGSGGNETHPNNRHLEKSAGMECEPSGEDGDYKCPRHLSSK